MKLEPRVIKYSENTGIALKLHYIPDTLKEIMKRSDIQTHGQADINSDPSNRKFTSKPD